MASSAARKARRAAEKAAQQKEQAPAAPKPVQPVLAAVPEPEPEELHCPDCAREGVVTTSPQPQAMERHRREQHGSARARRHKPEPEAEELNFMVPPGDLLLPEGVYAADKQKPLVVDYALDAHWQMFRVRNPDLRIFQKTMRAMMRVLMREEHAAVEAARAEARETGVPVRPVVPPLLKAIREELRQMKAEETGAIFDD
ncbi:hypothetical protein [Streptomyces sp. MH60]|uniref:hypothetical protein n=1 Tax=Streptomyces sp. MH60 TaxID=1940758 RepID=UPI000CEE249A|nr:hypothetical protein [Streptomyces sp. MH60]PPS89558.1 hypothetical protein BZZ08_01705 [Streptomyces sp. MH60]